MDTAVKIVGGSFRSSVELAAEKENVLNTIKYEKALHMLKGIRAQRLITPREYERTKELLQRRFSGSTVC